MSMVTVHLVGCGPVYERRENANGESYMQAVGPSRKIGATTFCGKKLVEDRERRVPNDEGSYLRVMASHDQTCRDCLKKLPGRSFAYVQPVMLQW